MKLKFNLAICAQCINKPQEEWDTTLKFMSAYGIHCHLVKVHDKYQEHFVSEECPFLLEHMMAETDG